MSRFLRLHRKSRVLAPLNQAFDILWEVVELKVALTSLASAMWHAAARHFASGKGVGQFPILVEIGYVIVAEVKRWHRPVAQGVAVNTSLREMHAADAEANVARSGYVKHLEVMQPLVEILLVLWEREKLQGGTCALPHPTQRHTAQRIFGVVQCRRMCLRSGEGAVN